MTATAPPSIPTGNSASQPPESSRRSGADSAGAAHFDGAFLRAVLLGASATAALPAQALPDHAQPKRGSGEDEGDHGDTPDQGADGSAALSPTAAAPLTIDGLNALLLVGGGRQTAASAARAELGSQAEPKTVGSADSDPRTNATGRRASEAALNRQSGEQAPGDAPRDAGQQLRSESQRSSPDSPRATAQPPTGGDANADPNGRQNADGRRHAGPPAGADPLRALSARALASPAAGGKAAGSAPGPSTSAPFVIRSVSAGGRTDAAPRATKPGQPSPAANAAHREALAAQMSRILNTAAAKGGGTMTMRLAPESLGAVTVRVGVEDGAVTARFEAATTAARDLLDASLSALRSSLEARGLSVDRLQVELAPESPHRAPEDQGAGAGTSGGGGGGGSADGRAGESGARDSAREGAEPPGAQVPDDRTDAIDGTDFWAEDEYLGLDAVA